MSSENFSQKFSGFCLVFGFCLEWPKCPVFMIFGGKE